MGSRLLKRCVERAYLAAVQDALAGLDAARVVLVGVTGRLRQRGEKGRG
jgi:hypothetical protein